MVTRIKTQLTKEMELKYIDLFCEARHEYSVEIAFAKAWQSFLSYVVDLLIENPTNTGVIGVAYDNIKHDTALHEKALNIYGLSKCNEEIQRKYMPLILQ